MARPLGSLALLVSLARQAHELVEVDVCLPLVPASAALKQLLKQACGMEAMQ
jgi:hypothetical protein